MAVSVSLRASLVLDHGPDKGKSVPIPQRLSIGRHPANDVSLKDLKVSRRHALVELTPEGPYLVDLKSSNGIYVNNVRAEDRTFLLDGDRIQIGSALFLFREE